MIVYIVLGVLYESYIHPLTILSTVPTAGLGALLALLAGQQGRVHIDALPEKTVEQLCGQVGLGLKPDGS